MTVAACRTLGFDHPQQAGKRLVVLVEIDRCLTDAIQALTGVSLGKRTLKHVDHGKAAATFVDTVTGAAVRVAVREEARELARFLAPTEPDPRRAQTAAYARLAEAKLLKLERVAVDPSWFARRRPPGAVRGLRRGRRLRARGPRGRPHALSRMRRRPVLHGAGQRGRHHADARRAARHRGRSRWLHRQRVRAMRRPARTDGRSGSSRRRHP